MTKEDKVYQIMLLVDACSHHERMQDSEAHLQCREAIEEALRQEIKDDE